MMQTTNSASDSLSYWWFNKCCRPVCSCDTSHLVSQLSAPNCIRCGEDTGLSSVLPMQVLDCR